VTHATRAEALLQAVLDSDPGDHVYLHGADCPGDSTEADCPCNPLILLVVGRE
jgi:hypothetical protein